MKTPTKTRYRVSERLPVREWIPNSIQIRQYAEVSGDYNPIHLDDKYACQAGLDGVIAHGMLTMAQMGAMLMEWIGDEGVLSQFDVRFEGMVHPGERIRSTGVIRSCTDQEIICELEALKDNNERVLSGVAHIRLTTGA